MIRAPLVSGGGGLQFRRLSRAQLTIIMARAVIGSAALFVGLSLYAGIVWWSSLYYFEIHELSGSGAGPGPPMLPPLKTPADPDATAHEPPGRSHVGTESRRHHREVSNKRAPPRLPPSVSESLDGVLIKKASWRSNWRPSQFAGGGEGGAFPRRGSNAFSQQCAWTSMVPQKRPVPNCTVLARPDPGAGEGISSWLSLTVLDGYVLARQSGCRLLLDYGEVVDVQSVIEPPLETTFPDGPNGKPDEGLYNWTVPPGFSCEAREHCFNEHTGPHRAKRMSAQALSKILNVSDLADAPAYRFAAFREPFHNNSAIDLQKKLPGFRLVSGLACALTNLFRLAPSASEFEPRLFTDILPQLKDENALVMSLYVRTGMTDIAKWKHRRGENVTATLAGMYDIGKRVFDCGESLEQKYIRGKIDKRKSFTKIVWLVITDSPKMKQQAVTEYNDRSLARDGGNITRTVLVTGSQGTHTRANRSPSTSDFAAAMIDWWLLGESDLVVHDKWDSFGPTAAFRTARPLYNVWSGCKRRRLIQ